MPDTPAYGSDYDLTANLLRRVEALEERGGGLPASYMRLEQSNGQTFTNNEGVASGNVEFDTLAESVGDDITWDPETPAFILLNTPGVYSLYLASLEFGVNSGDASAVYSATLDVGNDWSFESPNHNVPNTDPSEAVISVAAPYVVVKTTDELPVIVNVSIQVHNIGSDVTTDSVNLVAAYLGPLT